MGAGAPGRGPHAGRPLLLWAGPSLALSALQRLLLLAAQARNGPCCTATTAAELASSTRPRRPPAQVSTWERQERRKAAGALLPMKSRIPSWMHLPAAGGPGSVGALGASPSQDSLAG